MIEKREREDILTDGSLLATVRARRPRVHHITNYVTANDCANATLAVGASPVMADALEEAAEVAASAAALVLNLGTLNPARLRAMLAAGRAAQTLGVPLVLDPVGVGISSFRKLAAREILERIGCSVIKGNRSEILELMDIRSFGGIDALSGDEETARAAEETAVRAAAKYGCTIAMTGETDLVTDGTRRFRIFNGHPALAFVTGTGCMCGSLVAAVCGTGSRPLAAALCGVAAMGIAGEIAALRARTSGNGTMRTSLIDALSTMTPESFAQRVRVESA